MISLFQQNYVHSPLLPVSPPIICLVCIMEVMVGLL